MTASPFYANDAQFFLDNFNFLNNQLQPTQDADLAKQLAFVPGIKEMLMLRQVHALEHATVWILSEAQKSSSMSEQLIGGLSTEQGFYLYGDLNHTNLQRAVTTALQRLTSGEWNLALHPRCGTNVSVGIILAAGLAVGFHLLFPRGPIEQILGLGLATTTAVHFAPQLGILAQRYVTTAIPFNLVVENIKITQDIWGQAAHFVQVRWVD